jgi:hypothetical protein
MCYFVIDRVGLLSPFSIRGYDEGWNVALWGRRGITRGSLELLLFKVGVYNGTYCDVVWEGNKTTTG